LADLHHTSGARAQVLPGVLAKKRELLRGDTREPERAELLVRVERRLAEDLREAARAGPSREVHLEQPVLRRDIALQIEEVMRGLRIDVGDSVAVANHLGALVEPEQTELAVDGGERPVDQDEPGDDDARDEEHHDARRDDAGLTAAATHGYSRAITMSKAPASTLAPAVA